MRSPSVILQNVLLISKGPIIYFLGREKLESKSGNVLMQILEFELKVSPLSPRCVTCCGCI